MSKRAIKFLIAHDLDDSLVNGHIFGDTEITYDFLKHPLETGDLLAQAALDEHLIAITTTNIFRAKIEEVLKLLFITGSESIPIIQRETDLEEKNHQVLQAMKEYGILDRKELYIPLVIDDSGLAVEAALKRGWAGIVVPNHYTAEMANDPKLKSHLPTLKAVLDDPSNYAEICAFHNQRFGVYAPDISQSNWLGL